MWIEQRAAAQMAEALKKAVPDKKEHPIRISIITLVLAYSTFFYGLWYGIKRDMGYEVFVYQLLMPKVISASVVSNYLPNKTD